MTQLTPIQREHLALAVRTARGLAGMTQEELGDACGLSKGSIWNVENAKQPSLKPRTAGGLRRGLGWSAADLTHAVLTGEAPEPDSNHSVDDVPAAQLSDPHALLVDQAEHLAGRVLTDTERRRIIRAVYAALDAPGPADLRQETSAT